MSEENNRDERELWCDKCGEHPRMVKWDYDGVKIQCGCGGLRSSIYVSHKEFHDAPRSWKYKSKNSEMHVQY